MPRYPARYTLQSRVGHGSPWRQFGSGANSLDRVVERCRQAKERCIRLQSPTVFRVWDRIDQKEVVVG